MPTNVVKTKHDEKLWRKAKAVAKDAGHTGDHAYIMGAFQKMKGNVAKARNVVIDLEKADVKYAASLLKSDKDVAPYLAYAARVEQLARSGHLFTTGPKIDEVKLKLKVLDAYASAKTDGTWQKKRDLAKKGKLAEVETLLRNAEKWQKIHDACWEIQSYIRRTEAEKEEGGLAPTVVTPSYMYRSDLSIPDLKKSIQSHPSIAPSVNMHANARRPGAASEFVRRGRNPNRGNPEERYVNGLYESMPRGGLRTPEVNVQSAEDVVKGLGFSPQDESIWTTRVRGWINGSKSRVDLRKSLYASLMLEKSLPSRTRAELARRTDILFSSQNKGAGDFVVKAIILDGKPTLVKAQPKESPTGRQSTRGKPVPPGGRNPPPQNGRPGKPNGKPNGKNGPPRNGKGMAPGADDDRVKVHPPGKSSVTDVNEGGGPPMGAGNGYGGDEDDKGDDYQNGGNEDRNNFAAPNLDDAGLEEGPQDSQVITAEVEKLHKQLHEMHEKMEHTPGEVHLHNEIVAKMREVYADPTPEGLAEVRHKLHHFVEMVQGEEEDDGMGDDDAPNAPPNGFPPKKGANGNGPPKPGEKAGNPGGPPPGKTEAAPTKAPPSNEEKLGKSFLFLVSPGVFVDLELLEKGAGHRYLRRIPTGKKKPKYRYLYSIAAKDHDHDVKVGEKVQMKHGDQAGHYEVTKVSNGKVTIRHDETGHEKTVDKKHLHDQWTTHHADKVIPKYRELKRIAAIAMEHGTQKQKLIAIDNVDSFAKRFDLPPFKMPRVEVETAAAASVSLGGKASAAISAYDRLQREFSAAIKANDPKKAELRTKHNEAFAKIRDLIAQLKEKGTATDLQAARAAISKVDAATARGLFTKLLGDATAKPEAPKPEAKPEPPTPKPKTPGKKPEGVRAKAPATPPPAAKPKKTPGKKPEGSPAGQLLDKLMGFEGYQEHFGKLQDQRRKEGITDQQQTRGEGAHIAGSAKDRRDMAKLLEQGKLTISEVPLSVAAAFASRDKAMADVTPEILKQHGLDPQAAYIATAIVSATSAKPPKDIIGAHPDGPILFGEAWRELNQMVANNKTADDWRASLEEMQHTIKMAGQIDMTNADDGVRAAAQAASTATADVYRGHRDERAEKKAKADAARETFQREAARAFGGEPDHYQITGRLGAQETPMVLNKEIQQRTRVKYGSLGKNFLKLFGHGAAKRKDGGIDIQSKYSRKGWRSEISASTYYSQSWEGYDRSGIAKKLPAERKKAAGERKAKPGEKKEPKLTRARAALESMTVDTPSLQKDSDKGRTAARFNLAALQPGVSLNNDEWEHHVRHLEGAFSDIAHVIGSDEKTVSLNGRLGIAIGARGKSKAAAHYETDGNTINITRNGAGSLAHEWAHFLDNTLFRHENAKGEAARLARPYGSLSPGSTGPLSKAYGDLVDAMTQPVGGPEAAAKKRAALDAENVKIRRTISEDKIKLNDLRRLGLSPQETEERTRLYAKVNGDVDAFNENLQKKRDTYHSDFKARGIRLDGKKKSYWQTHHEMMARAFETYTADKLEAAGRRNDYLVGPGVASGVHPGYPQGAERTRINKAFDTFFAELHKGDHLKKALDWVDDLSHALDNEGPALNAA